MEPREGDLRGAGEIEPVGLDLVQILLFGRQEAGPVHRLLPHEHWREHGDEVETDEMLERVPVESELDERDRADPVGEA